MGKSIASRFENIDITRSVLRAVIINDDELTLEMDCCFHPGLLKFAGISKLGLDRAENAGETKRRFAIQSFNIEGTKFDMACEWGDIHLQARSIRVLTE